MKKSLIYLLVCFIAFNVNFIMAEERSATSYYGSSKKTVAEPETKQNTPSETTSSVIPKEQIPSKIVTSNQEEVATKEPSYSINEEHNLLCKTI